ncbi:thioesterase [Streptomyces viridochromogenes]|uniref:Thioesterase n=1 Tax=Streptomyces viridochromogenes TaxID=1938 RepID=A0A0J7ZCH1_STRVR|nr:thioesterase [Streptomyces viridochromogenes]
MWTVSVTGGLTRVVLQERPGAAVRLYCLPPAGAGAGFFAPWVGLVPAWVEVCSVSTPGRGPRLEEPSLTDTAAVAALVAETVDDTADPRPFAVFGHSVGALVAFEAVRNLRASGGRPPLWVGLSSLRGPQDGAYAKGLLPLLTGGLEGLGQLVGGAIPQRLLREPVLMAAACTPLLADCLLLLHHRHRDEPPLEVPLALYGGTQDPTTSVRQLLGWNELFSTPAQPRLFEGGHMYMHGQAEALVTQVVADLGSVVRKAVSAA